MHEPCKTKCFKWFNILPLIERKIPLVIDTKSNKLKLDLYSIFRKVSNLWFELVHSRKQFKKMESNIQIKSFAYIASKFLSLSLNHISTSLQHNQHTGLE